MSPSFRAAGSLMLKLAGFDTCSAFCIGSFLRHHATTRHRTRRRHGCASIRAAASLMVDPAGFDTGYPYRAGKRMVRSPIVQGSAWFA